MLTWHSQACRQKHPDKWRKECRRSLEQSEYSTRVSYLHRCEHLSIYFTSWNCSRVYINKHTFSSIHSLIHSFLFTHFYSLTYSFISIHSLINLVHIYWASTRNQLPVIPWWVETPCLLLRDFPSGGWGCSVCACVLSRFGRVQLFATPGAVAHQAHLSMGFSRQEYWGGLPFPSPGDLPNPGIKLRSPAL